MAGSSQCSLVGTPLVRPLLTSWQLHEPLLILPVCYTFPKSLLHTTARAPIALPHTDGAPDLGPSNLILLLALQRPFGCRPRAPAFPQHLLLPGCRTAQTHGETMAQAKLLTHDPRCPGEPRRAG